METLSVASICIPIHILMHRNGGFATLDPFTWCIRNEMIRRRYNCIPRNGSNANQMSPRALYVVEYGGGAREFEDMIKRAGRNASSRWTSDKCKRKRRRVLKTKLFASWRIESNAQSWKPPYSLSSKISLFGASRSLFQHRISTV